jgi:hypothetical protein
MQGWRSEFGSHRTFRYRVLEEREGLGHGRLEEHVFESGERTGHYISNP